MYVDHSSSAWFNDVTYVRPKVPTLYTVLSTGAAASDASIYGSSTNSFVLKKDDIVEIVVNNNDPGKHPFHLHGHEFQVVFRSEEEAGQYVANQTFPDIPMRRDTVLVRPNGNAVLRFKADNPDMSLLLPTDSRSKLTCHLRVWLFHCHIEWHVQSGLTATMIEAPEELQKSLTIPADHLKVCTDAGVPIVGNAAANTQDFYDLTGENLPPAPLPAGFTAKGIVALVFSCISAFLGVAVITW